MNGSVCLDSLLAISLPSRFKVHKYKWGYLAVSWCIQIIMSSASLVQRSAVTVCVVFLPVLAIDTFCSLSVLKTLKKNSTGGQNGDGEEEGRGTETEEDGGKGEGSWGKQGEGKGRDEFHEEESLYRHCRHPSCPHAQLPPRHHQLAYGWTSSSSDPEVSVSGHGFSCFSRL